MQKRHVLKRASGLVMGSSMLLLSMIPAASAFAATAPTVTAGSVSVAVSSQTSTVGGSITATASVANAPNTTLEYQFWIEQPNGSWKASAFQTSPTYTFTTPSDGDYLVVASAMTAAQLKANDWSAAQSSPADGVFVDSSVSWTVTTSNGSPATDVQPGTTLTVKASATNVYDALYQFWYEMPDGTWVQSGDYSSNDTFSFTAPVAGNYNVKVYAKSPLAQNNALGAVTQKHSTVAAYGTPAAVKLTAASSSLVADGAATDTLTATVVDSNGNTVADFNGSATLTVPSADGTVSSSTMTITNGVGTATLTAPSSVPSSPGAITLSALTPSGGSTLTGINYGSGLVLSYTAPAATSIGLTPVLSAVSSNGNNEDTVNVQLLDQAGNPLPSGNGSAYVTFTVGGVGSFADGSAESSVSEYVTSGSTLPLDVWSIQGESGAITVSASASGLSSASTTIQSEPTTVATKAAITSQTGTLSSSMTVNGVTLPAGWQYTVYTVQVEDASGVAVPSAQTFALSDSTTANGGTEALYYYAYNNGAVGSALSPLSVTTSSTTGQAQFAVFNTTAQSTPATITATDSTLADSTATAPYNFYVGSATQLAFNTPYTNVEGGQTVTYTVQLEDAAGNDVSTSGQTVDFYLTSNTAEATVDGSTAWSSSDPFTAVTNSQGQASVTVSVPSGTASDAYTVDAQLPNESSTLKTQTSDVVTAADYATEVGLASATFSQGATPTASDVLTLPTSMTAGKTLAEALGVTSVYGLAENSIGEVANTSDTLQITSSNPSVLAISGYPSGTATIASGVALPTITAGTTGSATLTIQDLSNPAMPKISATITVGVGTAAQISAINPNNTQDTAYTFPSTSGLVGPFTLQVQDGGGNVVPLTDGPVTLTANQVDAILGVPSGTGIATSTTSGDVKFVTIANDQSSVQVWVDNGSGALDSASTTATAPVALASLAPTEESVSVSGDVVTLTFSDPFTQSAAYASAFTATVSGASASPTTATVSGNTVTLTFSGAPSGTLAWTADTATSSTALSTAYGATLAAGSVTLP